MLLMSKSDKTKLILYTHTESKQFVHNLPQHALRPRHLPPANNHTQEVLCLEGRVRDVQDLHIMECNNIFLRTQPKTLACHFVLLLAQLNKFPALNICSCSFYVL